MRQNIQKYSHTESPTISLSYCKVGQFYIVWFRRYRLKHEVPALCLKNGGHFGKWPPNDIKLCLRNVHHSFLDTTDIVVTENNSENYSPNWYSHSKIRGLAHGLIG